MRHTITALLAVAALALAGCSSSGDGKPAKVTATVTATKTPELSAAEKRQACVDAWSVLVEQDAHEDQTPSECDGLTGQAEMYWDAVQAHNQANRDKMDACLEDPSCTSMPIP